ncbi:hypothetical protein [Mesorhizobium sp. ES1-4]|uniref:hypothetical protein n=1 Tax=Mesorhizobium sp. ES1-4 TaxID=2876627 RepID=UPI001CD0000C|nr:hypothetical protein [Mesorhizobium sp. ES1-4]MBZ9794314.1 hypothetical protein [Mesorhizobium sp. ES1-4]
MAKGWTIQGLIDGTMKVTAYCHNPRCHHHQLLDLEALKRKLGPDAPAMEWDLRARLRCRKCGNDDARLFGLIYAPDYDKAPRMPLSSPYVGAKRGR